MSIQMQVTAEQLVRFRKLVRSETEAYKNWIAGAVERKEFTYAAGLVEDLRAHEEMYKLINRTIREQEEAGNRV